MSSEWQPIKTAPMNGTEILIADRERVVKAEWAEISRGTWAWIVGYLQDFDGSPKTPLYIEIEPTHWMPLPEPPLA